MKGVVRLISYMSYMTEWTPYIDPIPKATDHAKDIFILDHFWFRKISAGSGAILSGGFCTREQPVQATLYFFIFREKIHETPVLTCSNVIGGITEYQF